MELRGLFTPVEEDQLTSMDGNAPFSGSSNNNNNDNNDRT